jgi:hypothetical protein
MFAGRSVVFEDGDSLPIHISLPGILVNIPIGILLTHGDITLAILAWPAVFGDPVPELLVTDFF